MDGSPSTREEVVWYPACLYALHEIELEEDRSVGVLVEDHREHALLRLALEVERIRAADLVPPDDELAGHGPCGLRGVPLFLSVAEEGLEHPLELTVHADV